MENNIDYFTFIILKGFILIICINPNNISISANFVIKFQLFVYIYINKLVSRQNGLLLLWINGFGS